MIFMDDGARTPRFSPFFTNTGFYFARRTDRVMLMQERLIRAVGEISYTASHQGQSVSQSACLLLLVAAILLLSSFSTPPFTSSPPHPHRHPHPHPHPHSQPPSSDT